MGDLLEACMLGQIFYGVTGEDQFSAFSVHQAQPGLGGHHALQVLCHAFIFKRPPSSVNIDSKINI